MNASHRLILLAHGSRDPRWRQPFESLLNLAKEQVGSSQVDLAYMEMCPPTLMDVATMAVKNQIHTLTVLPLFMSAGGHVREDIPRLAEQVMQTYPSLQVTILPPVGEHPEMIQMLLQLIQQACALPQSAKA